MIKAKTQQRSSLIRGSLFFLIFILCISVVSAREWTTYGGNIANWNSEFISTSLWDVTNTLSTVSNGADFQPLILDLNQDGDTEIVITSGNYLQIYQHSGTSLYLMDEYNMGSAQTIMMTTAGGDLNGNGNIELIVGLGTTNMSVFEYNNTNNLNLIFTNMTRNYVIKTGIKCFNYSSLIGCYVGAWNGTNSSVIEYNPRTNGISNYYVSDTDVFSTTEGLRFSPPVVDLDRDGNVEIVFIYDANDDGDEGIAVYDVQTTSLDVSFSADGIVDNLGSGADAKIVGMMVANVNTDDTLMDNCIDNCYIDYNNWYDVSLRAICKMGCHIQYYGSVFGGGDSEIIVTYYESGGFAQDDSNIETFKSDGSSMYSVEVYASSGNEESRISNPTLADVDGDDEWEICVVAEKVDPVDANDRFYLTCIDDDSGVKEYDNITSGYSDELYWESPADIVSADIDTDGYDEIIMGNVYFNIDGGSTLNPVYLNISGTDHTSSNLALGYVDITNNILDICGQQSGELWCAFSISDDDIPTLTDSYGVSWDNPVCNGTNLSFSANEYDETETQLEDTNYYNDIDTEKERLVADCYGNTSLTYGSWSLANPRVNCYYPIPTTYVAKIYLQDEFNIEDYTQYEEINILVIDGDAGLTCNIDSVGVGLDTFGEVDDTPSVNPTSEGIVSLLDHLTGGDDDAKLFIGFMIWVILVISVGGGMAVLTHNGLAVAIVTALMGVVGLIIMTALGMFPLWITIIVLLALSLLTFIILWLKGGS